MTKSSGTENESDEFSDNEKDDVTIEKIGLREAKLQENFGKFTFKDANKKTTWNVSFLRGV